MAKGFYVGVDNKARKAKKMYVGVDGKARKIKKVYIGVDGKARLCYSSSTAVKVTYSSSKTLSFTSKTINSDDVYGLLPTITPDIANITSFWFLPDATAAKDSSKKYIDYPWCAYADAHSDLYSAYGYAQDRLAKHYEEHGYSEGRATGSITYNTVCKKDVDHTLQHVYRSSKITFTNDGMLQDDKHTCAVAYYSDGTQAASFTTGTNIGGTLYPGMYIIFTATQKNGIGADTNTCSITINGTKVKGEGSYKYTIPNNVSSIYMRALQDWHKNLGWSTIITVTTTTI